MARLDLLLHARQKATKAGQQRLPLGRSRHRRGGTADAQRQIGVGDGAATEHHVIAATHCAAALPVFHRPHLAVGNHRHHAASRMAATHAQWAGGL